MGIIKLNRSANKAPETMQEEVQAPAANAAQPAKQEKRWQDPAILKEYSEKTDAQSRHFKLNNGTAKSIIGASPVNYYDETSQQWKSIDNSFTETVFPGKFDSSHYICQYKRNYDCNCHCNKKNQIILSLNGKYSRQTANTYTECFYSKAYGNHGCTA